MNVKLHPPPAFEVVAFGSWDYIFGLLSGNMVILGKLRSEKKTVKTVHEKIIKNNCFSNQKLYA